MHRKKYLHNVMLLTSSLGPFFAGFILNFLAAFVIVRLVYYPRGRCYNFVFTFLCVQHGDLPDHGAVYQHRVVNRYRVWPVCTVLDPQVQDRDRPHPRVDLSLRDGGAANPELGALGHIPVRQSTDRGSPSYHDNLDP